MSTKFTFKVIEVRWAIIEVKADTISEAYDDAKQFSDNGSYSEDMYLVHRIVQFITID
jgi:hypothetical protein